MSERVRIGYVDSVSFDYHLGEDADRNPTSIYGSPELLREASACVRSFGCGIYKVEIRVVEEVQRESLRFEPTERAGFEVSGHMQQLWKKS